MTGGLRAFALAFAVQVLIAAPRAAAAGLRLEDALSLAAARAAGMAAEADAAEAADWALPSDGIELRAQQGGLGDPTRSDAQVAVRLRWRGLAVAAAAAAVAEAEAKRLRDEAALAQAALAWEVERAFAQVLLLEAEVALRTQAAASWQTVASGMKRRAELGQEAALDVADAQVRAAEAGLRAGRLQAALETERAFLGAVVGAPVAPGGLVGPPPQARPAPSSLPRAQAEQAAADARAARADALPHLAFVQGGVRTDQLSGTHSGELSLAVQVPILDGSQRGRVQAAARAEGAARRAQAEEAQAAAHASAAAQGIAAGVAGLDEERAVIAGLRSGLPPESDAEPLATRALRARVCELEAELVAAERRLWP